MLFDAFYEACWLAHVLEEKFDIRLGRPSLSRKPHFAVSDPLARLVGRYFEFSSDVAKIDESDGLGELDILDPQLVYDYLLMPSRVEQIENRLGRLEKIQERQIMIMFDYCYFTIMSNPLMRKTVKRPAQPAPPSG